MEIVIEYNFNKEVKLFMIFGILGDVKRAEPLLWKIDRKRLENIKNHIFDLQLIIRILRKHLPSTLDHGKIHDDIICRDSPEAITGDIVVKKIAEDKDLADIFFEFHLIAVNITDEECSKYKISRDNANKIVNVIRAFANEMYSQKQNGTLSR